MLQIKVIVYEHPKSEKVVAEYVMDHDDAAQRRRLGVSCREAFEAGQMVVTYPVWKNQTIRPGSQ